MKTKNKEEKKSQLKTYARFSGVAIQMGITIYLGSLLGEYLDEKFPNEDGLYTKIVTLVAVFLSMYVVIKQVMASSSDPKE